MIGCVGVEGVCVVLIDVGVVIVVIVVGSDENFGRMVNLK